MDLHIELFWNKTARIREFPEVMLPETINVVFSSPAYNLSELVVNIQNGIKNEQKKVKGCVLDISEFCFAGVIKMEVHLIANGKAVKKWVISPIILNEIDKGFEVFDEIEDIKHRLEDLERKTKVIM